MEPINISDLEAIAMLGRRLESLRQLTETAIVRKEIALARRAMQAIVHEMGFTPSSELPSLLRQWCAAMEIFNETRDEERKQEAAILMERCRAEFERHASGR